MVLVQFGQARSLGGVLRAQVLLLGLQRTDDTGQAGVVGRHRPVEPHLQHQRAGGGGLPQGVGLDGQADPGVVAGQQHGGAGVARQRAGTHHLLRGR
ncbi:MAG: hypothetical protein V9G22_07935 [Ottowia sp.]